MPANQYTAEFTSNVDAFINEISQGLTALEARVQAAGGKIDSTSIGRDLGNTIVASFKNASYEVEEQATKLKQRLEQTLGQIRVKAKDQGINASSLLPANTLPGGAGGSSAEFKGLADEGIQKIGDSLRQALASLPPELEHAKPAMVAAARETADSLVSTLRATEKAVNAELKKTLTSAE